MLLWLCLQYPAAPLTTPPLPTQGKLLFRTTLLAQSILPPAVVTNKVRPGRF